MEYAIDVAQACRERDIKSVAVTAGYICDEPRRELYRYMDAANVDLKGFTERFYRKVCGAELGAVGGRAGATAAVERLRVRGACLAVHSGVHQRRTAPDSGSPARSPPAARFPTRGTSAVYLRGPLRYRSSQCARMPLGALPHPS